MKDILTKKAVAAIIIALFWTDSALSLSVTHHFDAVIGIFNAGEADFCYRVNPKDYAVQSDLYTKGIFDTLYRFKAQYFTAGKIVDNVMKTQDYSYKSQSRFNDRTKKIIYDQDGTPLQYTYRKNKKEITRPITLPEDSDNTTDLQSVLAALARQYLQKGFCHATRKVFDGKRRYNVIFEDLGREWLSKNERSPFFGAAVKCSMSIDRLKHESDDMLWKISSDSPVYFWIMQDETTGVPFIARINITSTPLGEATVYTTKIEVKK